MVTRDGQSLLPTLGSKAWSKGWTLIKKTYPKECKQRQTLARNEREGSVGQRHETALRSFHSAEDRSVQKGCIPVSTKKFRLSTWPRVKNSHFGEMNPCELNTCATGGGCALGVNCERKGNISLVRVKPVSLNRHSFVSSIPKLTGSNKATIASQSNGMSKAIPGRLCDRRNDRGACGGLTGEKLDTDENANQMSEPVLNGSCAQRDQGELSKVGLVPGSSVPKPRQGRETRSGAKGERPTGKAFVYLTHFWLLYSCILRAVARLQDGF